MKNEEQNIWDAFRSFGKNGAFRLLAQSDDCIIIRVENETVWLTQAQNRAKRVSQNQACLIL